MGSQAAGAVASSPVTSQSPQSGELASLIELTRFSDGDGKVINDAMERVKADCMSEHEFSYEPQAYLVEPPIDDNLYPSDTGLVEHGYLWPVARRETAIRSAGGSPRAPDELAAEWIADNQPLLEERQTQRASIVDRAVAILE